MIRLILNPVSGSATLYGFDLKSLGGITQQELETALNPIHLKLAEIIIAPSEHTHSDLEARVAALEKKIETGVVVPPTREPEKLLGTPFGSEGSWGNDPNRTYRVVFDGDIYTFFDPTVDAAFVGLDFGSVKTVKKIRFHPRFGGSHRMLGASFQGSNDQVSWETIHTITEINSEVWNELPVNVSYRYIKYQASPSEPGNIAELEFYS